MLIWTLVLVSVISRWRLSAVVQVPGLLPATGGMQPVGCPSGHDGRHRRDCGFDPDAASPQCQAPGWPLCQDDRCGGVALTHLLRHLCESLPFATWVPLWIFLALLLCLKIENEEDRWGRQGGTGQSAGSRPKGHLLQEGQQWTPSLHNGFPFYQMGYKMGDCAAVNISFPTKLRTFWVPCQAMPCRLWRNFKLAWGAFIVTLIVNKLHNYVENIRLCHTVLITWIFV